jgi:hypothetical protein
VKEEIGERGNRRNRNKRNMKFVGETGNRRNRNKPWFALTGHFFMYFVDDEHLKMD